MNDFSKMMVTGLSNPSDLPENITAADASTYLSAAAVVASTGFSLSQDSVDRLSDACGVQGKNSVLCKVEVLKTRIAMLDFQGANAALQNIRASELGKLLRPEIYAELEGAILSIK